MEQQRPPFYLVVGVGSDHLPNKHDVVAARALPHQRALQACDRPREKGITSATYLATEDLNGRDAPGTVPFAEQTSQPALILRQEVDRETPLPLDTAPNPTPGGYRDED
ncbi:MAG TPA: hypothetical protein VFW64_15940 [Pseudonocardiaceae bacterium]|nr:hypothetical protein [Pseudonocardiaceae bacterium]